MGAFPWPALLAKEKKEDDDGCPGGATVELIYCKIGTAHQRKQSPL